jgi:hypothetical protein
MRGESFTVFFLVLLALAAVTVRNFFQEKDLTEMTVPPESSDPLSSLSLTPTATAIIESDWKVFQSQDQTFRFRYPPDWLIKDSIAPLKGRGVYGIAVQSWSLSSAEVKEKEDLVAGVTMEFEISVEGRKQAIDNLIDCEPDLSGECFNQVVNGVRYKRLATKKEGETKSFLMVTVKNDRIYRISGLFSSLADEEVITETEGILNSFEILEAS